MPPIAVGVPACYNSCNLWKREVKHTTIKELRTQENLSQAEFAKKIGVAKVTISQIENGRINASPRVAAGVMEAFGVMIGSGDTGKKAGEKPDLKAAAAKKAAEKRASRAAAKKAPAGAKAEAVKAEKTSVHKTELYIQSPYGGEITPEQVLAKIPGDADSCYVRVDQNTIWWVRGEEYGSVRIW